MKINNLISHKKTKSIQKNYFYIHLRALNMVPGSFTSFIKNTACSVQIVTLCHCVSVNFHGDFSITDPFCAVFCGTRFLDNFYLTFLPQTTLHAYVVDSFPCYLAGFIGLLRPNRTSMSHFIASVTHPIFCRTIYKRVWHLLQSSCDDLCCVVFNRWFPWTDELRWWDLDLPLWYGWFCEWLLPWKRSDIPDMCDWCIAITLLPDWPINTCSFWDISKVVASSMH